MAYFYLWAQSLFAGRILQCGQAFVVLLNYALPHRVQPDAGHHEYHKMLEQSQSGNRVLVVALFLAIITSIIIVYLLKERSKKDRQLAAYSTEKRIARKLHDEIANEIYSTMLFIDNLDVLGGNKKEHVIAQLNAIYKSTRDISRENNEIDTGPHFPIQLRLMLKLYHTGTVNVLIKGLDRISWDETGELKKIAAFRILQELMVNMKKHSSATVVVITFMQQLRLVTVTYTDNGKGVAEKRDDCSAFKNIQARIDDIAGELTTETDEGKGIRICFSFTI